MHGYSRLGNGRSVTVTAGTTTPSPPSSPRLRHGRGKNGLNGGGGGFGGGGGGGRSKQNIVEKVMFIIVTIVFKRKGVLLFAPVLYISGMLLYMGSLNFDVDLNLKNGGVGVVVRKRPPVGSVYRSPQVFNKLWPYMEAESNGSYNVLMKAWDLKVHEGWKPCGNDSTSQAELPKSNGYLIIEANGGLNQQRLSICDAVAVAGLLNATLVIPIFHLNSVWQDKRAVRIAPFSNRLAHAVPSDVQGIRCLANFEALRFAEPIRTLAEKMVDRMIKNSSESGGKYVSVHLRFEMDMVAFSCCEYDGGEEERREMDIAREKSWRGKFRKRGRVIRPGANRVDGKCPLTPLEVGMMLRGMGFDNTTSVYVAAGNIYKAEKFMAPLKQMFPRLETKDSLATAEELAPFKGHSSRLAALDYTVCLHSEVFVTTQGGNFPHFLMGHRRYLFGGHAKTIKPDKKKLAVLFDKPSIRWEVFKRQMQDMLRHSDLKGSELRKPSASLYTFPMPDCMCKRPETKHEADNTTKHNLSLTSL
ncbi:O-fucosyltransferase 9 isoform X2 [Mercurialis annua]|uniref:O-fucosyltransferase 9 isoform X2 n=1 Tax=Mercurialis annua TaxID=3986 RepID=UPI00215F3DA7|nr:O-fucosyltransferase 9 isoform X2 [Mercurialis annua]